MIRNIRADKLVCNVYETREEMGKAAAKDVAQCIRSLLEHQEHVNMIFAAAPSQDDMLAALLEEEVDFSRIVAFHMDEYVGLKDEKKSFAHYLKRTLFDRAPFREVHLIGSGEDDEALCRDYAALLKENPVDIVCLGIGEN